MSEPNEIDCRCTCKECEARTQDTYKLSASCGNCRWKGVAILRKGDKPSWLRECPHCGRSGLTYGSDPIFDAPAPAQAREDEALILKGLHDNKNGERKEAAQIIAALRSRHSPPAEGPENEQTTSTLDHPQQTSSTENNRICPECGAPVDAFSSVHICTECLKKAAAPQPSAQGEDTVLCSKGEPLGPPIYSAAFVDRLRARLAYAQSSAQGEEAREMRDLVESALGTIEATTLGDNGWWRSWILEARAALERKEGE